MPDVDPDVLEEALRLVMVVYMNSPLSIKISTFKESEGFIKPVVDYVCEGKDLKLKLDALEILDDIFQVSQQWDDSQTINGNHGQESLLEETRDNFTHAGGPETIEALLDHENTDISTFAYSIAKYLSDEFEQLREGYAS